MLPQTLTSAGRERLAARLAECWQQPEIEIHPGIPVAAAAGRTSARQRQAFEQLQANSVAWPQRQPDARNRRSSIPSWRFGGRRMFS
ncbi:hypothetical protein OEZ85_011689 [Tetradesmus obliquus]|uniref:Uncharacterized protein n=1 Tax=Tetradesmus obliquus TaxID=3088 RepID=A0ABY8TRV4_TETOB|nr:hypothetical protein OEZ85_011689 [Tetradesmus obliquus]